MHHNLASVPSDDIEAFDTIINAGRAIDLLIRAKFDLVLHGHRHVTHCGHTRNLRNPETWQQGLFFVSADSLGCKENAPFLEVRLFNSANAHQESVPSTLFTVDSYSHAGSEYAKPSATIAEEALSRPLYATFGEALRRIGRDSDLPSLAPRRRNKLRRALERILPDIQQQLLGMVDWGAESRHWTSNFHFHLHQYTGVYATDFYRRQSVGNARFDAYLRDQYLERLKRLRAAASKSLCFSQAIYDAIIRIGWEPHQIMWKDYELEARDSMATGDLEIVRILVRPDGEMEDRDDIENLVFDHQLFAIPLFVLPSKSLGSTRTVDFAIGLGKEGEVMSSYEYSDDLGKVVEVSPSDRGVQLQNLFHGMLADKTLITAEQFLGHRLMVKDPKKLIEFAQNYDNSRKASPYILNTLRTHLHPSPEKIGLDIGCGTGNYTVPFVNDFKDLIGLDKLDEMLQMARKKHTRVRWIQADALNTTLPDGSVDAIWLISTLHYFKGDRQRLLFNEIYRILRPGGVVLADTEFEEQHASLWLIEFFPSLRDRYKGAVVSSYRYREWLEGIGFCKIKCLPAPYSANEGDAFLRIGQKKPILYLDPAIRAGLPAFQEMDRIELARGLKRLDVAIKDRSIEGIASRYEQSATMPGDIGFVVAKKQLRS